METRLLKMFCAIAETGSLGPASAKLHLTPSALSHGIKSLETQIGCRLFDRTGRKLILNQAGEQLLAQIRDPLAALDAAAESLKQLGKWGQARLRIAAAASLCHHLLPRVIKEIRKSHPRLELQIESGDSLEVMDMIRNNKVDLGLAVAADHEAGFDARPLFRDELMFVFAPSHPWADGRPISRDELRTQPLIFYHRSSLTARLINEFFRQLDMEPRATMTVGSMEAIKELVRLNLGVSVLAPWTVDRELVRGQLKARPMANKPLTRHWVVIALKGRRLTLPEENFCKLSRQYAAALRLDRKDMPKG
jgi:DNA-binding transcriptional LysR family regulator